MASTVTGNLTLDMSAIDLTVSSDYLVTVLSGFGNNMITASSNDNQINAGSGDDHVIANGGLDKKDLLEGGDGSDVLSLTSADFIAAALDSDILFSISGFEFKDNTYLDEESGGGSTVDSLVELISVVSIVFLGATAGENTIILSA